ncbi:unnamed protein product [Caenorhabditis auriculariae]|uniref:Uncharacterized protein n=1 Tax=Caenorhabditis auriculariae TaxID=2777116 RepID=A0A8S1HLX5_9PELO|nr:unnamed protein product [Caenorhabditis auriculariae]
MGRALTSARHSRQESATRRGSRRNAKRIARLRSLMEKMDDIRKEKAGRRTREPNSSTKHPGANRKSANEKKNPTNDSPIRNRPDIVYTDHIQFVFHSIYNYYFLS